MTEDHAAKAKEFLVSAGAYEAESRTDDLLASIAHSLVELTEALKMGAYPQKWVINNCVEPADVEAIKAAVNRSATFNSRR